MVSQERASELIRRQEKFQGNRGVWESHWQEIDDYFPTGSKGFNTQRTPGEKRMQKVYESTAIMAVERCAAALIGLLIPRAQKWHLLTSSNLNLRSNKNVAMWFEQVNDILFHLRYDPDANFESQQYEMTRSLVTYGTGAMFVDDAIGNGLRYKSIHLGELFIDEDTTGKIDTVFRKFKMTARHAVALRRSGKLDRLPDKIVTAFDQGHLDKEFDFLHCVIPNEDLKLGDRSPRGMKYASYYLAMQEKSILKESGYRTFPYSIGRYVTSTGEVYGRSPAMIALPDVKMINEVSKTDIEVRHQMTRPALLISDDMSIRNINTKPSALNFGGLDSQGREMVKPLNIGGNPNLSEALIEQRRRTINDVFLVTLFQILTESPQMTATEVLTKLQEKGQLLSPTIGRQQSEALGPMITRELDILAAHNMLPPVPDELQKDINEFGLDVAIQYDSPLNRAQRAEAGVGLQNMIAGLAPFAELDPTIYERFDQEQVFNLLADIHGVPHKIIRDAKEVAAEKEARQQQQQLASMATAAPDVAGAVKDFADAQRITSQI